jgi:hypothetical protein
MGYYLILLPEDDLMWIEIRKRTQCDKYVENNIEHSFVLIFWHRSFTFNSNKSPT